MLQGSIEDVGEDFHVLVSMGGKPFRRLNPVLVDHPQTPIAHKTGIVILSKREAMPGFEPSMIEIPPLTRLS